MMNILSKASSGDVQANPFPHVVIHNALDPDLYGLLEQEYPPDTAMIDERGLLNNERYQISAGQAQNHTGISKIWRQFIDYHTSSAFYQEFLSLFTSHIRTTYPWLEEKMGKKLEDWEVGVRDVSSSSDILLDCQPGINSPVTNPSRVRGPHLDKPDKLFAGLLYMRLGEDDSQGGDLEIYRIKDPNVVFYAKGETEDKYVEMVRTIPYKKNTLVFFLNTRKSLHGVSVRSVTPYSRRLVNFVGEIPRLAKEGLFAVNRVKQQRSFTSWLKRIRVR
jgi:hypothetical protein